MELLSALAPKARRSKAQGEGREAAEPWVRKWWDLALKGRHTPQIAGEACVALSGLNPRPITPGAHAPGFAVPRFQRFAWDH